MLRVLFWGGNLRKSILTLLLFFLLMGSVGAETFNQYAIKGGVGVRPLSMGGAFTAVCDDVNAIYYNPAGLADQTFGLSFANGNLNKANDYNLSSTFLNLGSLGYGWWGTNNPANNDNINVGSFAYGHRAGGGFNWGVAYKTVNINSGGTQSSPWSSDVGLLVKVTPWLNLGFLEQDIVSNRDLPVTGSSRFGVAFLPLKEKIILTADIEYDPNRVGENLTHCGAEFSLTQGLKIRIGWDKLKPTGGIGLSLPFMSIDYGFLADPGSTNPKQCASFSFQVPVAQERSHSIIKPKEFVVIDLRGALVGGSSQVSALGGFKQGVDSLIFQIKGATKDPGIDGIVLKVGGLGGGGLGSMAMAQEIRAELKESKRKGKKVVAYIDEGAMAEEYYVASAADKIILPRGASIGGIGNMIIIPRAKDLCDKLGIEWEIWSTGKYKETFSPFSNGTSPDQKEMLEGIVGDLYRQLAVDISVDRNIPLSKVKEIGDGRILTAKDAEKIGLIDEIGYFQDIKESINSMYAGTPEVKLIDQSLVEPDTIGDYVFAAFNRIAIISIDGEIVTGQSGTNVLFGGVATGSDTVTEQIRKAADDKQIKAIVLRVNSGGGSAVGSAQIYEELKRARDKGKVLVASMGDLAASGGYYVSLAAEKIVADPATITGSIGVIGSFPVLEKLYEKLGIKMDVVKEGKHMDMFSGVRKLTKEERASLEKVMEENYQEFLDAVMEERGLTSFEAREKAGGRIYTGKQAQEAKLVDELGGFTDAVNVAKELAKIEGDAELIFYEKQRGYWMQVGTRVEGSSFRSPFAKTELKLPSFW
ncbi:MAG: signal peptide peptidase SppA [Candidatus Saganbacteria bacterium]|nr:signal peptide peptidase SppA [Candidatus Saganbacteria bacterium]